MKIVAHEYDSKSYNGLLAVLSQLDDVSIWNYKTKSIFDMSVELNPDIIIIPEAIKQQSKSFTFHSMNNVISLPEVKTSANIFPLAHYNKEYESDILILGNSQSDINLFKQFLYPNQVNKKVKVMGRIKYSIPEYIGMADATTLLSHIKSTKFVVCFDEQTELNVQATKTPTVRLDKEKEVKDDVDTNYDMIFENNTYYHRAIEFYSSIKQNDKIEKLRELINESWHYYQ
jgi:hypothetical protein